MSQEIKQCKKCNIDLIPSKAIQNNFVGGLEGGSCRRESPKMSDFEIGETLTRTGTPHMIDCLKCPVCGYSVTAGKPIEYDSPYINLEIPEENITETTIEVKFKNNSGHHPNDIQEIIENHLKNFLHGCNLSVTVKSPIIEDDTCELCGETIDICDGSCI